MVTPLERGSHASNGEANTGAGDSQKHVGGSTPKGKRRKRDVSPWNPSKNPSKPRRRNPAEEARRERKKLAKLCADMVKSLLSSPTSSKN